MNDPHVAELRALLPQAMLPDWVRLGARAVRLFKDRLHPDKHHAVLQRLLEQARVSVELRQRRAALVPRPVYPAELPITARKDDIIAAIRSHQVVVLAGETGSGKTTQIPKMCLEAGLGIEAKIGCTQPRRVAALSISRRIAEELNVSWGREVGCKIRFDDRSSPETFIKLMTDGILLAETQGDPDLSEYNCLILDEAHERSLNIDFLLGYLKTLLARRADLKLIVTSATIDTEAFSRHFDHAPVIEVSGRMYPVEVAYRPLEAESDESDDLHYVDGAVAEAERILCESSSGDLLIFMPGERDIRETADQLEGRFGGEALIIPLFGRLSSGDQQRVFAPSARRKVVIATNIAETSLTIPGIRYVIDSGLARISRYNARTRTKRLPVEAISQSSANQRKGRAGRVQDGFCVRLYSEDDFNARPTFTQPEIQRANLAEVILRMKAFHLGDIATFPFVQPPSPAAVAGGYSLLQELGALDEQRELTPLGRDLARLPIDPTLGRMLLQSQREHATRELLIIASGLSIQDPRERPLDQKDAAAAAHRKFNDPQSDFLALLNIWNAVHDEWETLRTAGRRKFCRQHFLSYLRMREWQDLHAQLEDALGELRTLNLNESNASYDAIHRSILAGLIGHVARREERNTYKGAGNRLLTVFPGSALYARGEPPKKPAAREAKPPRTRPQANQPQWIVAGEIVETSQLFARTNAGIDPHWIFQLAPHACKRTRQNPHWSASAGRVLIEEIITLHGLEVQRRNVSYGNINPPDATAIFIRAALVEENLLPAAPTRGGAQDSEPAREVPQYSFLAHNRALRQKIEDWQTRVRRYDFGNLDQRLAQFYAVHLTNVSSLQELNRFLREPGNASRLCATEADIVGELPLTFDAAAFPETVHLREQPLLVRYAYAPGEEWDGVTIELPLELARAASPAELAWSVPGLRAEQAGELLRSLPKSTRRALMPLAEKVTEIVREFRPRGPSLTDELAAFIRQRYGVLIPREAWNPNAVPAHLRPRVEVIDHQRRKVASGRDLAQMKVQLPSPQARHDAGSAAWQRAVLQWERPAIGGWSFGDLPERITVEDRAEVPVFAWPGLALEDGSVSVRLFRAKDLAREASVGGATRLLEMALQRDFGWLQKDLRALSKIEDGYAPLGSGEELQETAFENARRFVLPGRGLPSLTRAEFEKALAEARQRLSGLAPQLIDRIKVVLQLRQQVVARIGTSPHVAATRPKTLNSFAQLANPAPARVTSHPLVTELSALMPPRFLEQVPFERLTHLPRYLKALLVRAERAALNPAKDQDRMRQLAPYLTALQRLTALTGKNAEEQRVAEEFRWLVEEFKVSLFAQELGTAVPVSPRRLDEQLARCGIKL